MIVQHNLQAMNSNRMLGVNSAQQAKSSEKLSSGFRVNRAADDAAGLSISEKMRRQVRGLNQASVNAQDGISAVQTAEGALNEVHSMLQRMNELATQSANGTLSADDRLNIQAEIDQIGEEINRVSTTTKFNETMLLNGDTKSLSLHVGADGTDDNKITVELGNMDMKSLFAGATDVDYTAATGTTDAIIDKATGGSKTGTDANEALTTNTTTGKDTIDVSSAGAAAFAVEAIKVALKNVSDQRSTLGAAQNRLEHTIANIDNVAENTQAAESRIRDLDMAKEMVDYSKNNILAQAGQSMLAQANQATQGVLSLLR